MPKFRRVRALSEEESCEVNRLIHARTEPARLVERARIIWSSHQGRHVPAIAALSKPTALGLPFGSWTLDRLEVYLNEEKGLPIKRSRIDELLISEHTRISVGSQCGI